MDSALTPPNELVSENPLRQGLVSQIPTGAGSAAPKQIPKKKGPAEGLNNTKPKQSKSRNGCVTCKSKRLKCDETKPTCRQCQKRNVSCGGYRKDFKWRSFEESSFATRISTKSKKAIPALLPSPSSDNDCPNQILSPRSSESPKSHHEKKINDSQASLSAQKSSQDIVFPHPDDLITPRLSPVDTRDPYLNATPNSPLIYSTHVPDLKDESDIYLLHNVEGTLESVEPDLLLASYLNNDNEEIEEIVRQTDILSNNLSWDTSTSQTLVPKPLFNSSVPVEPVFASKSNEMLLMRFDRKTCGILSVKDGVTENPWRTLVWPMAKESPALHHAICALAAFHCSKEDPGLKICGMDHMRKSVRTLAKDIRTMRTDAALATTLALAFAEAWDRSISNGIQHLRGARILVTQALENQQLHPAQSNDSARLRFLYNTWVYTAVIARLTSLEDGGLEDFPHPPGPAPASTVHEIDPLLGCAASLFPLIDRVASLVQKVCSTKSNSITIISQAMELKTLIEQWEPPKYFQPPEDPTSEVQHSFQTAQAYRWATLLHLHCAVPEIPSESSSELANRVLVLLATVPLSSRAIVLQIFPLLVASCEIDCEEDRDWVRERWAAMQTRLCLSNIDRCLEVIYTVWSRRDDYAFAKLTGHQASYITPLGLPPVESEDGTLEEDYPDGADYYSKLERRQSDVGYLSLEALALMPPMAVPIRRNSTGITRESYEYEKTVRGKLHWLRVMRDLNWEVLLG